MTEFWDCHNYSACRFCCVAIPSLQLVVTGLCRSLCVPPTGLCSFLRLTPMGVARLPQAKRVPLVRVGDRIRIVSRDRAGVRIHWGLASTRPKMRARKEAVDMHISYIYSYTSILLYAPIAQQWPE